jgi:transcriptional regulator with XRE-family HTH domain
LDLQIKYTSVNRKSQEKNDIISVNRNFLGDRIKSKLKEKKISQKILAELIDIPQSTLSEIIKNKYNPNVNTVKLIAHFLEVDLNWLITGISAEDRAIEKLNEIIIKEESEDGIIKEREVQYGGIYIKILIKKIIKLRPQNREKIIELIDLYLKKEEGEK